MRFRSLTLLIAIHILLSLGGLLLHLRIHPPTQSLFFWWAAPTGAFSLLVIPLLYLRPSTVAWGVLFNFFAVAVGVIGMAYFSLHTLRPLSIARILFSSTLPDIALLLTKLPLALLILREMRPAAFGVGGKKG